MTKGVNDNKPGPDRKRRCTMKRDHKYEGLKAPDIFHINSALKVKQLLRPCHLDFLYEFR